MKNSKQITSFLAPLAGFAAAYYSPVNQDATVLLQLFLYAVVPAVLVGQWFSISPQPTSRPFGTLAAICAIVALITVALFVKTSLTLGVALATLVAVLTSLVVVQRRR